MDNLSKHEQDNALHSDCAALGVVPQQQEDSDFKHLMCHILKKSSLFIETVQLKVNPHSM